MTRPPLALALAAAVALSLSACPDDQLSQLTGTVDVEVRNMRLETKAVALAIAPEIGAQLTAEEPVDAADATHRFERVPIGLASVRAQTLDAPLDAAGVVLDQVNVFPVGVVRDDVTLVVIDFATGDVDVDPPPDNTPGVCLDGTGQPDPARDVLCGRCTEPDGAIAPVDDDDACGLISCDGLDSFHLDGDNTPTGRPSCLFDDYAPLGRDRCASVAVCKAPNDPATCGAPQTSTALSADVCETIANCAGVGPPALVRAPDGTPCGTDQVCIDGACVDVVDPPPPPPPPPSVGCADGAREGFLDQVTFPSIAACAGAFSVGGVTRAALTPTCNRGAGDDGANRESTGCSAADLCEEGWHVCGGKTEVAAKAPGGCASAVPPGTPEKALFFAVGQHSSNGSVCDDASTGDNDVFGCGNLGNTLGADKNCGPLTRVLASTQANRCGFNEAEPPLGPWQCQGGSDSHLHEGAVVTKGGCPNTSCSYDGAPIGNSDKGGVLCCR